MSIYLDHNATTPLRPEVWETMARIEMGEEPLRNPSSVHRCGLAARREVRSAREFIASSLGAQPEEIVFTGGGSEAINLAIKGSLWAKGGDQAHVVTSQVEHHAVTHALDWLGTRGARVTSLPVDSRCIVEPEHLQQAITEDTALVSVMYVNNEVGAIQPVQEIGAICQEKGILFHVDAVQAVGKLPVDVDAVQCDLLSFSAHKLGGPKGVGALYVRSGTGLSPLVHGGPQEGRLRAGTENVAGIAGFAEALRLALEQREDTLAAWTGCRDELHALAREMDGVRVNSHPDMTVPNCVNMTFMYCDGMALTMNLSRKGVYVSTGSACTAGDLSPSHVLKAMGLSDRAAHGAIRFSMGYDTTREEVAEAAQIARSIVERLRLITMPEDIGQCKDDCPCFVTG